MTPETERTRAALDALADALERAGQEVAELAERTRARRAQLGTGARLRDVVGADARPLVVKRVSDLLELLAEAGAGLRRAEAVQLREEGLTQAEIAALYGVSRQRVAALLAPGGREG